MFSKLQVLLAMFHVSLGIRLIQSPQDSAFPHGASPLACCKGYEPSKRKAGEPVDAAHQIAHLVFRVLHREKFYDEGGCGHRMPPAAREALVEAISTLEADLCGSMTVPVETVRKIHRHLKHPGETANAACSPCGASRTIGAGLPGTDEMSLPPLDVHNASKVSRCPDIGPRLKKMHDCLSKRATDSHSSSLSTAPIPTAPGDAPKAKQYAGQGSQLDVALRLQYGNWCGVNAKDLPSNQIEGPDTSFHSCRGNLAIPSPRYSGGDRLEYDVCADGGTDEACLVHDHGAHGRYVEDLDVYVMLCKANKDLVDHLPKKTIFKDMREVSEATADRAIEIVHNVLPCSYWDMNSKKYRITELWWWDGDHGIASCGSDQRCYLGHLLKPNN
eukprot:gnl/TRDRNA2_/TRDRNA2_86014_c0_seq1.p1 gnl/TRDRNA2_/TRDRNA2_86014_c0~~gnl/TRDRNA2_/TRDRNA2_86014_c0_seq1.p1  ORF type:complete len:387 (+),score=36.45 gnl/TRDRNA2_/TRDRNA2_86014_c0_seq1:74-1234(+)